MKNFKKLTNKRKTKSSRKSNTTKSKKPFGGYAISFTGRKETLEQVFGQKPVTPSEMTKKIWGFVKTHKLSTR